MIKFTKSCSYAVIEHCIEQIIEEMDNLDSCWSINKKH